MAGHSIVEYFKEREGYRCGYCGNSNTNYSNGMWAHEMTCEDYQDLIDRGWRRSGKYCYKPMMDVTCCPPYTIKCAALQFQASKSQKKVIKHMNKYLTTSESKNTENESTGENIKRSSRPMSPMDTAEPTTSTAATTHVRKQPKPGLGADANKPPCRKAKVLRMERKQQKLALKTQDTLTPSQPLKNTQEKSLEEFLLEYTQSSSPAHKLGMKLVRADMKSEEFRRTFKASHKIYQKYQVAIHKDPPEKVDERQFQRFLIDSPLQHTKREGEPSMGYGSFHQQYYMDGVLFAIGVLDILPRCISSVYLFYDPDYGFLSPGVYSALREIYLTQQLHKETPSIESYYMGFYIHSCPKMKYKGNYHPSYLVCPVTYNWVPIKDCTPKLDISKYSRLDYNAPVPSSTNISKVLVLHNRQVMPFPIYIMLKSRRQGSDSDSDEDKDVDPETVQEYANLVGPIVASRMLLYRS